MDKMSVGGPDPIEYWTTFPSSSNSFPSICMDVTEIETICMSFCWITINSEPQAIWKLLRPIVTDFKIKMILLETSTVTWLEHSITLNVMS